MFKKIFANRLLITTFIASIASLLAFAATGFAWLAMTKQADTSGAIAQVGQFDSRYEFGQIINNTYEPGKAFQTREVIPGQKVTFVLSVSNDTDAAGEITVFFSNVHSGYDTGDGTLSTDYSANPENKIQYAYEYQILNAYWIPSQSSLEMTEVNQENPLPTSAEINEWGWVTWTDEEKRTYYETGTYEGNSAIPKSYNDTKATDTDETDYGLLNNVPLDINTGTKSAFVIYFQIEFKSEANLPTFLAGTTAPNSNVYVGQQLLVDNIVIVSNQTSENQ